MDMQQFRSTMEANHWKQCLMCIIFDNSMRWNFDHTEKDANGKVIRYLDPEEVLIFDDENECIKLKEYFAHVDQNSPDAKQWYFYTVRNVENIQAMVFCDLNNTKIRPFFDTQMM